MADSITVRIKNTDILMMENEFNSWYDAQVKAKDFIIANLERKEASKYSFSIVFLAYIFGVLISALCT